MPAKIIDGKSIADRIRAEIAVEVASLGYTPGLGIVLVGDDAASHMYVSLKEKACAAAGIRFEKKLFPADASEEAVLAAVDEFNKRADIDGILIQLPLPEQIDAEKVIRTMSPAKDADGFHPENIAAFKAGTPRIVPALAAGVMEMLRSTGEDLDGKFALVIGNSQAFYEPLKIALSQAGALAALTLATAPDIATRAKKSEIIIIAVGRTNHLTGAMVSPGTIVIDVGTNKLPDGRTVGDVQFETVNEVAAFLSPVPGGVGPMTVAMLLRNVVALAKLRRGK